jgi:2-(1,2-epoxy-1,2-dihydrophenyl)acetyl-CoA isomerase
MPDAGGTWFLPKRIGLQKAMGLALTGESITGERADELGLIWKSFEDEDLEAETLQLAKQLANMPGYALTEIKKAIYSSMNGTLNQQLALETQAQDQLGRTLDFREGVDAFLNKRSAKFNAR